MMVLMVAMNILLGSSILTYFEFTFLHFSIREVHVLHIFTALFINIMCLMCLYYSGEDYNEGVSDTPAEVGFVLMPNLQSNHVDVLVQVKVA
jgi:hypothetical protein